MTTIRFADFAEQGGSDQTANLAIAVQAALASADRVLDITGTFSATHLCLTNINGMRLVGRGSISGIASSPTPALIDIRNAVNLNIDADWYPNAQLNTNYEAGVRAWAGAPGETISYCRFNGVSPVNAKTAWKFGDESMPDALISETEIRGGMTRGCPSAVLAIGTQTVLQINGGTLMCDANATNPAWQALPQRLIVSRGATITRNGGENLHTQISNGGTDSSWNAVFHVEAIQSPQYGAQYGNINVVGGACETATYLGTTANGIAGATKGAINIDTLRGVTMVDQYFMASDHLFTGRMAILGASDWFSVPQRTLPIFYANNPNCKIITNKSIYGDNFWPAANAFVNGIQTIGA